MGYTKMYEAIENCTGRYLRGRCFRTLIGDLNKMYGLYQSVWGSRKLYGDVSKKAQSEDVDRKAY